MKGIRAAVLMLAAMIGTNGSGHELDRFVHSELAASGAPGVAFAIVDHGRIQLRSEGETLKDSTDPVTPKTPFRIGSLTKGFTALAILQLEEANRLELGGKLSTYLPAFADAPLGQVTVRQLLNHTSGLSTVQGNLLHSAAGQSGLTLMDHVQELAELEPAHQVGTMFEYSNANYQILGAVIEQRSGQSYAEYIQNHIFRPLSMTHSSIAGGSGGAAIATGHRPWFGGTRAFEPKNTDRLNAPAGGISASADDMARYIAMLLNGRDDIVSAAGKARLFQPSSKVAPFYGLGWYIDRDKGTISHTGLVPGSESLVTLVPEEGKGVVVLVNSNSGFGFGENWTLRNGIAARALGFPKDEGGSNWMAKATYLSVALLLPLFVLLAVVSWRGRSRIRTKRASRAGLFSLWFPLAAMTALAWVLLFLMPRLFGGSLATLRLYQPDFALLMITGSAGAIAWALFRLVLAYHPRSENPFSSPGRP